MKKLIWLDLETTGLDRITDAVLEIAIGTSTLEDPFQVSALYQAVLYFPEQHVGRVHPRVQEMHEKNGLWKECSASRIFRGDAEDDLLKLIPAAEKYEDAPILAGSTIHFDRDFLRIHMPALERRLHYRHLDVSSVKLFCQSLGMPPIPKGEAHRAWADVLESVDHARQCRRWLARTRTLGPLAEIEREVRAIEENSIADRLWRDH